MRTNVKPKHLTVDYLVAHWTGRELEWHRVVAVSAAKRRYGDEGDWVYHITVEAPDGRRWTKITSARSTVEARYSPQGEDQ